MAARCAVRSCDAPDAARCRAAGRWWTGCDQIDPEEVLPHPEEVAVGERRLAADRDVGAVGRAEIRRRLDGVELFVTQPGLRAELRTRLGNVADLERLAVKLAVARSRRIDTWRRDMKGSSVNTTSPDSRPMIVSSRCR